MEKLNRFLTVFLSVVLLAGQASGGGVVNQGFPKFLHGLGGGGGGVPPGTQLAGNNEVEATEELMNPNEACGYNAGYTATATATLAEGKIHAKSDTNANIKLLVYNSSGNLIATSNPVALDATPSLRTVTFSGGPTITTGQIYFIAAIGDGYFNIYGDSGSSWATFTNTGGNYASPPASIGTPGGDISLGGPHTMYITA